jgi:hypothetical protein
MKRAAERVAALRSEAGRGSLLLALLRLTGCIREVEEREMAARNEQRVMVSVAIHPEASGLVALMDFSAPAAEPETLFIFYSLSELAAWIEAPPARRAAIEFAERSMRDAREAKDFAKLDLLTADAGRVM